MPPRTPTPCKPSSPIVPPNHLLDILSGGHGVGVDLQKGKHDRDANSSSGHHCFNINPPADLPRVCLYVKAEIRHRYWEMGTSLPWSDAHLPDNWHLSTDRVPIPPIPVSGRAHHEEIYRGRVRMAPDLAHDPKYAMDSPL
ncbi:hypothetical protein D1007_43403 [Hordeum vulgare]|nr:hypothetical protein D1007_43403 [Hordeum vulgare]